MATRIAPPDSAPAEVAPQWSTESARTLYNVEGWGAGFFDVNERGHVIVRPDREGPDHVVDLFYIVLEQLSEIDVLLQVADEMEVTPTAGVRIKLASRGFGRWKESGGEKSKFGLNSADLVGLIERLKSIGRLDIIKLIHFHLGSQITDIRFIKLGLQEVTRFYVELRNMGLDITHVDVGGGLGIDYDGTNSEADSSVNYSLQEL